MKSPNRSNLSRKASSFRFWAKSSILFSLSLMLPGLAIAKLETFIDFKYIAIYLVVISVITMYTYWHDKGSAKVKMWRTPEQTLHTLEFLGGWHAAYISQRIFWHKISKSEYQFTFWIIAITHQYISLDYLLNWKCTTTIYQLANNLFK